VEQTYYRWRKEYGGLRVDQARRLKELEHENAKLTRFVSELSLEKLVLKPLTEWGWVLRLEKWISDRCTKRLHQEIGRQMGRSRNTSGEHRPHRYGSPKRILLLFPIEIRCGPG